MDIAEYLVVIRPCWGGNIDRLIGRARKEA